VSAWQTRRVVRPVVVPEKSLSLIGSVWMRRHREGDEWDAVRLTGLFDCGNDHGGIEACVTPVSFGPVMTTSAEGLAEAYTLKDESAQSIERLGDLFARAASL
jgi:hypothetical protein